LIIDILALRGCSSNIPLGRPVISYSGVDSDETRSPAGWPEMQPDVPANITAWILRVHYGLMSRVYGPIYGLQPGQTVWFMTTGISEREAGYLWRGEKWIVASLFKTQRCRFKGVTTVGFVFLEIA
jgi:hypothetical protein